MGGLSGGGYASAHSSLPQNIKQLAKKYPLDSHGRFGTKDRGAQVLKSSDPGGTAKEFFEKLGRGGSLSKLKNGKGHIYTFKNNHTVVLRLESSSGSPAVSINMGANSGTYKIHFQPENYKLKGSN